MELASGVTSDYSPTLPASLSEDGAKRFVVTSTRPISTIDYIFAPMETAT
jgi:hypothetical protein